MLLTLVSLAWAAEVQLELDDAVKRAWENHAEARVQAARIEAAEAAVRPERAPEDPQLRARWENVGSRTDTPQYTVRIRQDLEPIGAIRTRVRAARAAIDTENADLAAMQADVHYDTALLFDAIRFYGAIEALAVEEIATCDAWIEVAKKRKEAEVGDVDDVLEAEFAKLGGTRRRVSAERERRYAEAELAALVGASPDDTLVLTGPDLFDVATGPLPTGESASVARARARLAEETAQRAAVAADRRPFLDWVQTQAVFEPNTATSIGVSFAASIPVFSLTDGALAAADADVETRRAELTHQEAEAERRAAVDSRALDASAAAVRALQEQIEVLDARIEEDREAIRPDRLLEITVDLIRERQDLLELAHEAAVVRRRSARGVMLSP